MASGLKIGQHVQGKLGTYSISGKLHRDVWTAVNTKKEIVIVKTAPKHRLNNEREVLEHFRGRPYIRQLVDQIQDPPSLVLKHFDDNLLNASNSRKLDRLDIKFVAKRVLQALKAFHEDGYVHTDVKPDNIFINHGKGPARFSEAELGDFGDTCRVDPNADPKEDGHVIGAAIFRSPEAMLNLRWGTPTDIWSFGATLISLIWGENWHIFKPGHLTPDDEAYPLQVLIQQVNFFGPVPLSYQEIADEERLDMLARVIIHVKENEKRKPFAMAEDPELTTEDRTFICKIMKLDPRDRPTARELLKDEWFMES